MLRYLTTDLERENNITSSHLGLMRCLEFIRVQRHCTHAKHSLMDDATARMFFCHMNWTIVAACSPNTLMLVPDCLQCCALEYQVLLIPTLSTVT